MTTAPERERVLHPRAGSSGRPGLARRPATERARATKEERASCAGDGASWEVPQGFADPAGGVSAGEAPFFGGAGLGGSFFGGSFFGVVFGVVFGSSLSSPLTSSCTRPPGVDLIFT